jgi:hypothetical protein
MAEILKAETEQRHSAPHYATKKAAHKARLATLENINKKLHLSPLGNTYQTERRSKSLVDTPPGLTVITTVSREQELWGA